MTRELSPQEMTTLARQQRPAFNDTDYPHLMQYASIFSAAVAGTQFVDPCMLAAIVEQESGGQNILQNGMKAGDPDCGVGLCQITYGVDWSNTSNPTYPGYGSLFDPATNLKVAAHAFLDPVLGQFPGNYVAAFAAYNAGASAVKSALAAGRSPDSATTGGNYGTTVYNLYVKFLTQSLGSTVAAAPSHPVTVPNTPPKPAVPAGGGNKPSDPNSDLSNN